MESLENILDDIQDYVKKATKNSTELPLITDRTNPGEEILEILLSLITLSCLSFSKSFILFVFSREKDN